MSAVATGLEKVCFHSHTKEGQCQRVFRLPYNCAHFTCQSGYHQNPDELGFSSIGIKNLQMYKQGFEESEEPEIKLPTFIGSWRKQGNFRKTTTSASVAMVKL